MIRSLALAGAERQAGEVARGLAAKGHQVHLALLRDAAGLGDELGESGVAVSELGGSGVRGAARTCVRLVRLFRQVTPDAVYGFMDAPNVLVSSLGRFAPGARRVSGVRASELATTDMPRISRLLYALEPHMTRCSARIIVNSEAGRDAALDRGFSGDRLTVIPNGIDADHFRPPPSKDTALRHDLGLRHDDVVIARIGRLHPMKDYETFLHALAMISSRGIRLAALCVGEGPSEESLRHLTHELGLGSVVRWIRPRLDVRSIYWASDVVVSSSRYGEGLPNVVAEAMACGVTCVVTDVGDSALLVGEAGEVVDPGDAPALADAILRVLDRLSRGASYPSGRERILARYSLERMINATESVLLGPL